MTKALIVVDMQNDFVTGNLGTPEARAIANGTSVADTINTLVRGTSLEKIIDKVAD